MTRTPQNKLRLAVFNLGWRLQSIKEALLNMELEIERIKEITRGMEAVSAEEDPGEVPQLRDELGDSQR